MKKLMCSYRGYSTTIVVKMDGCLSHVVLRFHSEEFAHSTNSMPTSGRWTSKGYLYDWPKSATYSGCDCG
jgi:hypothetical protein